MNNTSILNHSFTPIIIKVLEESFGDYAEDVFLASPLIGYLNQKTRSANRGSKARGAFANHYALYVIVEDYIKKGFFDGTSGKSYSQYEGARFSDLFARQCELPFGSKLQNHGLNSRLNDEFKRFYPTLEKQPIIRDVLTKRYWIQEDLLQVQFRLSNGEDKFYNIAKAVLNIIDKYVSTKLEAFELFLETCRQISLLSEHNSQEAVDFIASQLQPNVDARIFEIVSYAVLKAKYRGETIWIGFTKETISEELLSLYKTGRTNANDGGIDFVMKPLGRFFQVTETVDVSKYFLDIDKVQRFPITFVIKSEQTIDNIKASIRSQALSKYKIDAVIDSYMHAIEEVINVTDLLSFFTGIVKEGKLNQVMEEVILQSKVEFNFNELSDISESVDILEEIEQIELS